MYWGRRRGVPNSPQQPTQVPHSRTDGQQALPRHSDDQGSLIAEENLQHELETKTSKNKDELEDNEMLQYRVQSLISQRDKRKHHETRTGFY